jgi:hypothetical protein
MYKEFTMRYTQGGFMESNGVYPVRESSWLLSMAGCVTLIASGIATIFVVTGYIYLMRMVIAEVTNIFP